MALAGVALFAIGAGRAMFTDWGWMRAELEMLAIGAAASAVTYGIGALGR